MKTCGTCGESYADYIDYCFSDGNVLAVADVGVSVAVRLPTSDSPVDELPPTDAPNLPDVDAMDAPRPKSLPAQGGQQVDDNTPGRRRSLLGKPETMPRDATDAPEPGALAAQAPSIETHPSTLIPEAGAADEQETEAAPAENEAHADVQEAEAAVEVDPEVDAPLDVSEAAIAPSEMATPVPEPLDEDYDEIDRYQAERQWRRKRAMWVAGVVIVGVVILGVIVVAATGIVASSGTVEIAPEPVAALPTPPPRTADPEPAEAPSSQEQEATDAAPVDAPEPDGGSEESEPLEALSPEPDVPEPDVPEPDVPEPDVPEPDVPEPDVPEPDVPEPDAPDPGAEAWGDPGEDGVVEAAAPTPEPPPAPASSRTGPVIIFYSGRVGDTLSIDGKPVGTLPARLELTEGPHTFSLVGASGDFETKKTVTLKADGTTTMMHLDH